MGRGRGGRARAPSLGQAPAPDQTAAASARQAAAAAAPPPAAPPPASGTVFAVDAVMTGGASSSPPPRRGVAAAAALATRGIIAPDAALLGSAAESFSLAGQTALVTGAASGIGQSIALGLAQCGANVALVDRNEQGLAETAALIVPTGKKTIEIVVDVTSAVSIDAAVARAQAELPGPLTLAVNCAGIANGCAAESLDESVWDDTMNINLKGVWLSCLAEGRAMIAHNQGGSIVNIASISGTLVNRGLLQTHYNTSKAGVIHLSKSLAMEWVKHGIRVNSISPGYTATPMAMRADMKEQRAMFEEQVPMERMASPDEMVGPAVFLLSRAASYVTGHDLVVDGGASVW